MKIDFCRRMVTRWVSELRPRKEEEPRQAAFAISGATQKAGKGRSMKAASKADSFTFPLSFRQGLHPLHQFHTSHGPERIVNEKSRCARDPMVDAEFEIPQYLLGIQVD